MIPGIHASVSGGLCRALDTLEDLRLPSGQIFTSNQRQWKGRIVRKEEVSRFRGSSRLIISHTSYLINLASTSPGVRERSLRALEEELERMHQLGISWAVLHPGAHLGSGEESAIRKVSQAVRKVLSSSHPSTGILFENTAGQGTSIGHSFQHLTRLMEGTGMDDRTGICFDTCHAFAAGYPLASRAGVDDVMDEVSRLAGMDRIRAFHMNDCLGALGSHRDRHARMGEGLIGLEPLRYLASLEALDHIPGIVETPGSDSDRAEDARALTDP